jgi:hypothetical protein
MKVTMIEDRTSAPDGLNVVLLRAGETYDLPEELALSYIQRGRATASESPDEPTADPAVEDKADEPVDENTSADPAVEDKADEPVDENKAAPAKRKRAPRKPTTAKG